MILFQIQILFFFFVTVNIAVCLSDEEASREAVGETEELRKQFNLLKDTMSLEISKLKNENKDFRNENEDLRKRVTNLEKENKESNLNANKIKELKATLETKSRRLLGHELQQCQCHKNAAFSASLKDHMMNIGTYQTIKFDNVFTNENNVYSPMSGVFTAPSNGTYFFTATIMSHSGQYLETEIALNGNSLVYMYSYDTHYEQGTNSVVLPLKTGDMVWVRHQNNEGSNVHGGHWSSFAGFQIN